MLLDFSLTEWDRRNWTIGTVLILKPSIFWLFSRVWLPILGNPLTNSELHDYAYPMPLACYINLFPVRLKMPLPNAMNASSNLFKFHLSTNTWF